MKYSSCESLKAAPFDAKVFFGNFGAGTTSERFQKNHKIYVQGEAADTVCFLHQGQVKATALSELGKEAIVGIFHEGKFFGEACLGTAKLRTSTVVAMEECLITSVEKQAMLSALDSEPLLSAFFMTHLLSRNVRIEEDLIDQLLNSSERRLARLLLVLASPYHEGQKPIPVTLSQEVLAEMVGTTRSRVSTFMNKFRDEGLINYDSHSRRIEVYPAQLLSLLGS
ncbi:cAMP-binding domain of CRP or a regulatory subunit of cAMP-dependent protein kinases [Bradyrhizobium erythrophlei]|nr:cAMP-binding domain of CRP or a regulatory subunit of cAMP-dependent protein kinases [Bradyrhizobium erythrophlei]